MTPFIVYQLKVALCLSLFTSLYYLLFRKETFHMANRIYLVFSLILSVCIPLIKLPAFATVSNEPVLTVINPVVIQGIVHNTQQESESASLLSVIYITMIVVFSLTILGQIVRLLMLTVQYKSIKMDRCKVFCIPQKKQSFSFFQFIFITSSNEEEYQILQHEMAHAKQFHTLDILLLQTIKIFQWFNPFIYLIEKAIQETHEYLADEAVMEHDGQSGRYRMLLVTQAFGVQPGIFNFFNYSLIKNRLIMITKERSLRRYYLKYLSVLPLVVVALLLLSAPVISQTSGNKLPADKNPPQDKGKPSAQNSSDVAQEPAYVYVDKLAEFQGGSLETFREWVQKELIYPPEAVANKIQGRIVVQFAVNSVGKVCDIKVLRGVNPLLDNEAIRVVESSPDWVPAKVGDKNVKQQFVFPIIFSVSDKGTVGNIPPPPPPPPPPAGKTSRLKFQGSEGALALGKFYEWVQSNVVYPAEAKANGIQGKIEFTFTIMPSGKMGEVKILRGVHPLLDDEILRVVRSSPDWEPFPQGEDKAMMNLMTFIFKLS